MKSTVVALASILATSTVFVGAKEVTRLHEENKQLKKEIKYNNVANRSHIEDVIEINKNNCKLIVYESSQGQYTKDLQEDSFIPVKSTLKTTYSYKVEVDLSKAKVMEINNVTYVEIDYSTIRLSSISIDQPTITNETNFLSQFKGKAISENNNQILIQSYDEIEQHINKQFKEHTDTYKINLQEKVNKLYENLNVVVTYK